MPKNIVFIVCDELRYDSLGYMGHPLVRTPHIDRLAGEGQIFEQAFCASPLCVPSRVAMFTGQYISRNGATFMYDEHHVGGARGAFSIETMKAHGYKLGLAGKNHTFTDEYMEQWFDYREEYSHWGKTHGMITEADKAVYRYRHEEKRERFLQSGEDAWSRTSDTEGIVLQEGWIDEAEPFHETLCQTHRIAEDAIRFMKACGEQPFFLYCSFPDPHWPNVVCEPYHSMYAPDLIEELDGLDIDWSSHPFAHYVQSQVNGFDSYSAEQRKHIIAAYYGMITYIDKAVGMVMDAIERQGLAEETIIVFTADHGNFAGRYGMIGKTKAFYDCLLRIPLVMKAPGLAGGGLRRQAQLSNIDLFPTLFELIGLPTGSDVQGVSFADVLRGSKDEHRTEIFAEVGMEEPPPPPLDNLADFAEFAREQAAARGTRWFLDYTVRGRSACIRKNGWKYSYYTGDREELYDLENDPKEICNLAADPRYGAKLSELRAALMEQLLLAPLTPKL
ncbi:sulfatase [Paenibacillus sp. 1P07SE]|uniref:sulfatase family protein n=1 Tax=Paenibacillus sp. 1P07SE TaxID=3132209 RepID=UPI0039A6E259